MTHTLSTRLLALVVALGTLGWAVLLAGPARGGTSSESRLLHAPTGALVTLRKTALGPILVDARGRTLYLFEKDRGGISACNTACLTYWPAFTSRTAPRAGKGVRQSMLKVVRQHNGLRQVTYAGHPLYTFIGDKLAGQTTGEGLSNFGADWYVLTASGKKVEQRESSGGGYKPGGGYSPGGGW
jgi:predicted lipoprotein with Yx(FWY)xxD motif